MRERRKRERMLCYSERFIKMKRERDYEILLQKKIIIKSFNESAEPNRER